MMKNDNDVNNIAVLAVFIFALTIGGAIGYMTAVDNWNMDIVVGILIIIWVRLFIDIYKLKYKPSYKNNNHLLNPNTYYSIDVRHGWININDCRYRYNGNVELLNLDRDGDVIMTTSNPNYITRYPSNNDYKVLITILGKVL